LEAAAIGRPGIASNIHGCKETVNAGISGFLCRVKDTDNLYQNMLKMAGKGRSVRESMGLPAATRWSWRLRKTWWFRKRSMQFSRNEAQAIAVKGADFQASALRIIRRTTKQQAPGDFPALLN
jgi:glycosyltransferase involved in cell wall biosynthesis